MNRHAPVVVSPDDMVPRNLRVDARRRDPARARPRRTSTRMSASRVVSAIASAARSTRSVLTSELARRSNLFELAARRDARGIGERFVKASWTARPDTHGDTFWTLTRMRTRPSGRSGDAWGVLTWKGRTREGETRINGSMKRIWSVLREGEGASAGPTLRAPGKEGEA